MRYHSALALDNLNLELPQGKIIGLLGPNGSGKTTFIKLAAGLLTPAAGEITICGEKVGTRTKAVVSYLPDRPYFSKQMRVSQQLDFFQDFYEDFDRERAEQMLYALGISPEAKFRTLSKGTQEKVQLVLVMSRRAKLYLLDEPIGGVDPAARDYILNTIISNYDPDATILISTHLISDVERVLDEFLFLHQGRVIRTGNADETREETGKSLDELFREVFRCLPNC
ncbi:MAG: ABC transporter ATP-binding protein [Eubacteriales bacterium]|nr:ABC transporter ATP-binding protein [Eubacteriales bacterium]